MKGLILKIEEFAYEILNYWYFIILITLPILGFMVWKAYSTPVTYKADLTFMLNEDDGNGGLGGVSAILGQFGFGRGRSSKFNLEKMFQLAKSRRITQEALFDRVQIAGKTDYVANHIITIYEYHRKWEKDTTGLQNFVFQHDSTTIFNRVENKALKRIYLKVVGWEEAVGLLRSSTGEDTEILTLSSVTENEELSILLTRIIYDKLSDFYVSKSIERQKVTYDIIKGKADSLQSTLNVAQSRLLRFQDANRGLTLLRYEAEKIRLQQEIQKLIVAYGESYKQLEIADFTLRNSTPVVQIIDSPISPIKPKKESKLKAILTSIFLGGFLGTIFIIGRKILRDAIRE